MAALKAIVFDFDGTLIESTDIKTQAFATLFRGFPEHLNQILEYHLKNLGISRYVKFRAIYRDILRRQLSKGEEKRLGETFRNVVLGQINNCPLVEGAEEFLRNLKDRYACLIASGAPEGELQEIVHLQGLAPYFQGVYGSPRSKREILGGIRKQYGFKAVEMLFVGDALCDQQAAEKENMPFIGRVEKGQPNCFPLGSTIAVFEDFVQLSHEWSAVLARFEV